MIELRADGRRQRARHGLGVREVYGRLRLHTVTWLDGDVQVEGVEADDYPVRQTLISRLRRPGQALARTLNEVPVGYEGFEIVEHQREIEAPYSPRCLAVKIAEDDLASWVLHAWLRSQLPRSHAGAAPAPGAGSGSRTLRVPPLPPPPAAEETLSLERRLTLWINRAGSTRRTGPSQPLSTRHPRRIVNATRCDPSVSIGNPAVVHKDWSGGDGGSAGD